jgi:hypothetical protein
VLRLLGRAIRTDRSRHECSGLKNPGEAARWIAGHFKVPDLPVGKHLVQPARDIFRVGFESDIGLLVRSGLWAQLSPPARSIVPVLLELGKRNPLGQTLAVQVSYRALARSSGVASHRAIARVLRELQEIHWLTPVRGRREPGAGLVRTVSTYVITPRSDELLELANAHFAKTRDDVEVQRRLRAEQRSKRSAASLTK